MTNAMSQGGASDPWVGRTLAEKYSVVDVIGRGSMGAIYRAEHINLGKMVAIKVIHAHLLGDEELIHRFHREARAASMLHHPNCVQVVDFGQTTEGLLYIAMEFINGQTLGEVIEKDHPVAISRLLEITRQICLALDEAHAKGVLHRDLKPDNVMVEDLRNMKDRVRVVDFGIAKLQDDNPGADGQFKTRTGVVCGTPEYMSPEQLRGDGLDHRSDLYALGCLLYHLLQGDVPFLGESPLDVAMKHLSENPPPITERPPATIQVFEPLLQSMLSKEVERRPSSAMDVHAELERIERDLANARQQAIQQPLDEDATIIEVRRPSFEEIQAYAQKAGMDAPSRDQWDGRSDASAPEPETPTRPAPSGPAQGVKLATEYRMDLESSTDLVDDEFDDGGGSAKVLWALVALVAIGIAGFAGWAFMSGG